MTESISSNKDSDDRDTKNVDQGKEPKRPSPFKNPLVLTSIIVVALIVAIAFIAWFANYWTRGRFVQDTNDAYLQADQVTVAARVAGYVEQVFVADNQAVGAGHPLVRIDARDPRAKMQQALAQVDQGQASIVQARAQIHQQEAQITQSEAQLAGAKAQAVFAEREATRYAPLSAAGVETVEKFEQVQQNRDQAKASMAQNAAAVVSARRQIDIFKSQILAANAQIEQARAQVRESQVDFDATMLSASIDGRVGDKTVRVGQYVQPGTRLMTVVPVADIYVIANFKETQLGLMRIGQPATIKVDALKGDALHGRVESFSPGTGAQFALIPPNNATGNFTKIVQRVPVRIHVDPSPESRKVLVPGMSVKASVDTFSAKSDAKDDRQVARRATNGAGQ